MTGFTCREHIATEIQGRTPMLCKRWIPSFARSCSDCGAPTYRGSALVARILAGTAFDGLRAIDVVPKRAGQRSGNRRPGDSRCRICGEPGHYTKTCAKVERTGA